MADASTLAGYEVMYVTKVDLDETKTKAITSKIEDVVKQHDGEIVHTEEWGKRKLAYTIKKESRGLYTYTVFTGDNKSVAELERNFRINENLLRFMCVKIEDDFDKAEFLKGHVPLAQREKEHAQKLSPRRDRDGGGGRGFKDRGDRGDRYDRGDRGGRDRY